ncbi:unnamed protein product [Ixodes persulcatus]
MSKTMTAEKMFALVKTISRFKRRVYFCRSRNKANICVCVCVEADNRLFVHSELRGCMLHRGALITPICFFFVSLTKKNGDRCHGSNDYAVTVAKGWTLPLKLYDYWSMIPIAVLLRWTNKGTPTTGAQGASHCNTHSGISESTTNHDHLHPCMHTPAVSNSCART